MSETIKRIDRADIAKYAERAEKLLQRGKAADALELYLQLLACDPGNDGFRQMAADLCLSLGRVPEAARLLGELFEKQVEHGDGTRASLTYKKLARFVNPTWEQKLRFGQLLENSNRKLALDTYENAYEELRQQGRKMESLSVLKRAVALDSTAANFERLGELYSELGDHKASAASFMELAGVAKAAGNDAARWFERAYTEWATDPAIALAYANTLIDQDQAGAAIHVLEPHAAAGASVAGFEDAYAKALLSAGRLVEAEPIVWGLFEQDPTRMQEVGKLIELLVDAGNDAEAVALARKLEQFQRRRGDRRSFLGMMQEIVASHRPSAELLEYLSEQFNASNREADYCLTLVKLFDLYYDLGDFPKAAEALDRAAEVDAYEVGHQKRLESLKGKIDDNRFQMVSSRLQSLNTYAVDAARSEERTLGASTLQDLMLQAEILVQYGMQGKAIERLQRIQQLFPGEEERNQNLQQLYLTAGLTPPAAAGPSASGSGGSPSSASAGAGEAEVTSFTQVAEITRKLYRQSNSDAVLSTTVEEIGAQWRLDRCLAAICKPGLTPTAIRQYSIPGTAAGSELAQQKLISVVQELAISRGALNCADTERAPELASVREVLAELNIGSLLALPLTDGSDAAGILVLAARSPRLWSPSEVMVLKTISEQIVIALNNAGLRRLVRNLSVTDETSGLLKRASYVDLLLAETRRAVQNSTAVTVLLMQVGERAAMLRDFGEAALEAAMQKIGQIFAANIRQNDLAFRYESTTIAMVLGETNEKEALMAVEKLRKIVAATEVAENKGPVSLAAGIAEAVVRAEFDPVDIVTEVINRAEQALEAAHQRPEKLVVQAPSLAIAAVA
jgi:diguanylate cyclase (GGDEF)-like protein